MGHAQHSARKAGLNATDSISRSTLLLTLLLASTLHSDAATSVIRILDSEEVNYGTYSIFYNRVEGPILKLQTAAPTPLPTAAELEALRKSEAKNQLSVSLGATIYDGKLTVIRWFIDGSEYVFSSNINFNYLRSLATLETEQTCYSIILSAGDEETLPAGLTTTAFNPADDKSQFRLITQPATGARPEAAQFMRDLHTYYDAHKAELILAWQQSETARVAHEQWRIEHPPAPKDIIIEYYPIHSNFDALKNSGTK